MIEVEREEEDEFIPSCRPFPISRQITRVTVIAVTHRHASVPASRPVFGVGSKYSGVSSAVVLPSCTWRSKQTLTLTQTSACLRSCCLVAIQQ